MATYRYYIGYFMPRRVLAVTTNEPPDKARNLALEKLDKHAERDDMEPPVGWSLEEIP